MKRVFFGELQSGPPPAPAQSPTESSKRRHSPLQSIDRAQESRRRHHHRRRDSLCATTKSTLKCISGVAVCDLRKEGSVCKQPTGLSPPMPPMAPVTAPAALSVSYRQCTEKYTFVLLVLRCTRRSLFTTIPPILFLPTPPILYDMLFSVYLPTPTHVSLSRTKRDCDWASDASSELSSVHRPPPL